jgi:hypothetical protein
VYSRDVVFRERKDVVKHEFLPSKEEPDKIEFDLKDDELDSTEEWESEEEDPSYSSIEEISLRKKASKKVYSI